MKRPFFLYLILLIASSLSAQNSRIVLYVDQQKTVNVKGAEQISIAGKGEIATGTLLNDGKQIVITGKAPGTVSMTVAYKDGNKEERTIKVISREREQVMMEFEKIAPLFDDIQVLPLGDNIGLTGKIYSIRESDNLNAFLERYPEIINLMEDCRGDVLLQMDVRLWK